MIKIEKKPIYITSDGQVKLAVKVEEEIVWLDQKQMAELFDRSIPTINEHISNIFDENELNKISVIRKFRIVQNKAMCRFCTLLKNK